MQHFKVGDREIDYYPSNTIQIDYAGSKSMPSWIDYSDTNWFKVYLNCIIRLILTDLLQILTSSHLLFKRIVREKKSMTLTVQETSNVRYILSIRYCPFRSESLIPEHSFHRIFTYSDPWAHFKGNNWKFQWQVIEYNQLCFRDCRRKKVL